MGDSTHTKLAKFSSVIFFFFFFIQQAIQIKKKKNSRLPPKVHRRTEARCMERGYFRNNALYQTSRLVIYFGETLEI